MYKTVKVRLLSWENVGQAQVLKAEMSSFPVPPLADPVIVGKVN